MIKQNEFLPPLEPTNEIGWPGPDLNTEVELSLMYGEMVNARRVREQAIAQADMPPRAIVI